MTTNNPQTLAWHETLEIHELVAFQAIGLMKLKKGLKDIQDPELRKIYTKAIQGLDMNLRELLKFYPYAPQAQQTSDYRSTDSFLAGDLLAFAKTAVRNYAIAITETATPAVRKVMKKQLNQAIDMHEQIFSYMYKKGLYPSYNLSEILKNDMMLAKRAMSM
ncbi:MAG TPA: spore coat protein [Bacillus bacterium]|nr:spore coat protein [Bacillus sp. (in: firmicutes)]